MYENLRGRLKQLAKLKLTDDGMGIFRISAEGLEAIKGIADEAENAIEELWNEVKAHRMRYGWVDSENRGQNDG